MSTSKPKSLADIIGAQSSEFGQLAEAAQLRANLSDYLRNNLEDSLAAGLVHCNIHDDGTLVVLASSPEWAARLRFESQQFLDLCKQQKLAVRAIKFRVSS